MEEAAVEIEVGRVLYVSENVYVESGDHRHEIILYQPAAIRSGCHGTPSDPRMHEWHRPGDGRAPCCRPTWPRRSSSTWPTASAGRSSTWSRSHRRPDTGRSCPLALRSMISVEQIRLSEIIGALSTPST